MLFFLSMLMIITYSCTSVTIKTNDSQKRYWNKYSYCRNDTVVKINNSDFYKIDSITKFYYQDELNWTMGAVGGAIVGFVVGGVIGYSGGNVVCSNTAKDDYDREHIGGCVFVPMSIFATIGYIVGGYYTGEYFGTNSIDVSKIPLCVNE